MGSCRSCLSYTAARDGWYRYSFSFHGLKSSTTDLGEGTRVHCWSPKKPKPSNPNLLLIHGFGANAMWQWDPFVPWLGPHFNLYIPDLLFFGGSSTLSDRRSESFQAQTLMALMRRGFGVESMSLAGISYGGFVAYSLAAQFPEAVEKTVLCCSGVCLEEKDMEDGMFKVKSVEEVALVLIPQTHPKLRHLIRLSFYRPFTGVPSFFLTDFIQVMCTEYVEEKRQLIEALYKNRKLANLPKITHPTLIIWGEQDQIFPTELAHRLKRHLGDTAQVAVIKKAGHAVNIEKAKEMMKHLKSFLIDPTITKPRNTSIQSQTHSSY
ncbi:hypothetical protein V2J09_016528 [Rumex salicifolius]